MIPLILQIRFKWIHALWKIFYRKKRFVYHITTELFQIILFTRLIVVDDIFFIIALAIFLWVIIAPLHIIQTKEKKYVLIRRLYSSSSLSLSLSSSYKSNIVKAIPLLLLYSFTIVNVLSTYIGKDPWLMSIFKLNLNWVLQ